MIVKQSRAEARRIWVASLSAEERTEYNAYMRDHMRKKHAETPWYSSYCNRKSWALRNGVEFTLTQDEMSSWWGRGCALTGIPFEKGIGHMRRSSGTLDKIVPTGGYTKDNCLLVRSDLNSAKGSGTYDDLSYLTGVLSGERAVVDTPFLEITPEKCGDLLKGAQRRGSAKNLVCEVTREFLRDSYSRQNGRCAVTGIPFAAPRVKGKSDFFSCSLDKEVPEKGYTLENSRMVIWGFNSLKGDGTDAEAIEIATKVRKYGMVQSLADRGF